MIDDFRGKYRFLSNFQASTVEYEGELYPTVENAYQAAKTLNLYAREEFTRISAKEAKRAGKTLTLREDWEEVKFDIMLNLVRQKFCYKPLADKLLATGDKELVEGNWWGDTYWGVCRGNGENNLGKILMKVRDELNDNTRF